MMLMISIFKTFKIKLIMINLFDSTLISSNQIKVQVIKYIYLSIYLSTFVKHKVSINPASDK